MVINNCLYSTTSENFSGFWVWCVLTKPSLDWCRLLVDHLWNINEISWIQIFVSGSFICSTLGKLYIIGTDQNNTGKLEVFYTGNFQPTLILDQIRLATQEEIIAMKIDVVQRGGRKKDFWDLHAHSSNPFPSLKCSSSTKRGIHIRTI